MPSPYRSRLPPADRDEALSKPPSTSRKAPVREDHVGGQARGRKHLSTSTHRPGRVAGRPLEMTPIYEKGSVDITAGGASRAKHAREFGERAPPTSHQTLV